MITDKLIRLFPKFSRQPRWWDFPAVLMLVSALFLASLRLSSTRWTEELPILHLITLSGAALGLALGYSVFSGLKAAVTSAILGVILIGWQVGLAFSNFRDARPWSERMLELANRINETLLDVSARRQVEDSILFLLAMALLFWGLSCFAGYSLTRHGRVWRSMLPVGAGLFIIHVYDPYWPTRAWFLAGYIFLVLLLVSRVSFLQKQHEWVKTRTHMPPFIMLDLLRATMVAGLLIIAMAWTAPALAATIPPVRDTWAKIAQPYYDFRDEMSNLFAPLRSSVTVVSDVYGNTMSLGRGTPLSDEVIMSIAAPEQPNSGIRYYWRARSYSTFDGLTWGLEDPAIEDYPLDELQRQPYDQATRMSADFVVAPNTSLFNLFTASQTIWVDRPIRAEYMLNSDGTQDIVAIRARTAVFTGESYQFRSQVINATAAQLRDAGTSYPFSIRERYLQLPDSMTSRTLDLAEDIAGDLETPYDQVVAITNYLRQNIEYTETIPAPPRNQDVVDWFLFDLQQGFCNYYATAEVLMLRALGIPARLGVGYAQGELDRATDIYSVRQRDAHAWPEVYFPEIGWVEFEPTAGQDAISRLSGEVADTEADPLLRPTPISDSELETTPTPEASALGTDPADLDGSGGAGANTKPPNPYLNYIISTTIVIVVIGGIGVLGFFLWTRVDWGLVYRRLLLLPIAIEAQFLRFGLKPPRFITMWAFRARLPVQARAYEEINRSLKRLGTTPALYQTPAERASLLADLLPEVQEQISSLLHQYQRVVYSTANGEDFTSLQTAWAIRTQSYRTLLRRFLPRPTS